MHIELRDIRKYFGPVKANDGISLVFEAGQIYGLLGENGAGKTEIMYSANMSYGQVQRYLGCLIGQGYRQGEDGQFIRDLSDYGQRTEIAETDRYLKGSAWTGRLLQPVVTRRAPVSIIWCVTPTAMKLSICL